MSKESQVGRTMFNFKDLLLNKVTNTIIETMHKNKIVITNQQQKELLSTVGSEIELLFNNATDSVLREVKR